MATARSAPLGDADSVPRMPAWVSPGRGETPEDVAFQAGGALAALHLVVGREDVPQPLLRARLAMGAAEACARLAGRPERAEGLRDAVHLTRPGDRPGPAGEIALVWLRAVERPVSVAALHRALPQLTAEAIAELLDAGRGGPVARAALVLEAALAARPRDETAVLILADAALALALGWTHVVPLLAAGLPARALRLTGAALIAECHRAVAASARAALPLAADLARRAARLEALAPKLRAKGAGAAVALVLSRDAVSPAALAGPMSDRAARRFCDRLVDLGAVRELTGRETFRLYGL